MSQLINSIVCAVQVKGSDMDKAWMQAIRDLNTTCKNQPNEAAVKQAAMAWARQRGLSLNFIGNRPICK